jgi:hypothetical protein
MPNKSLIERIAGLFKRESSSKEGLTASSQVFHNPTFGLQQDPGEGGASEYWDVSSSVDNSGAGALIHWKKVAIVFRTAVILT